MAADRGKIIEAISENAKKPGIWAKVITVVMTIALLASLYYDIREDIHQTQKNVSDETGDIEKTSAQVEVQTAEAVVELRGTMQFLFDKIITLSADTTRLERENVRLRMELDDLRGFWSSLLTSVRLDSHDPSDMADVHRSWIDMFGASDTSGSLPFSGSGSELFEEPYVDATSGELKFQEQIGEVWKNGSL